MNIDLSVNVRILYSVALTEADLASPCGRLIYIGIICLATFLAFVWNPWTTSPERTKIIKAATDQAVCTACGSEDVYFDTDKIGSLPVKVTLKKCGYCARSPPVK